jgi:hypothetical protein
LKKENKNFFLSKNKYFMQKGFYFFNGKFRKGLWVFCTQIMKEKFLYKIIFIPKIVWFF